MADIMEAFNTLKTQKKPFQNIDYFFTQTLKSPNLKQITLYQFIVIVKPTMQ